MKHPIKKILSACILSACATGAASANTVLLKIPFGFHPKLPNIAAVAETLNTIPKVNNSLKVKIYAPGKLVPQFEILDAVSTGKVNAGLAISAYWAGKIPAAAIFSAVPFGPEVGEMLAWYSQGNGAALHQEMYDQAGYNVHPIACGILAPASGGWFNKEINSIESFKGVKMRSVGLGARVLSKLGVSTSSLPLAEIYPALEKGALDAAEVSGPAVDTMLGFHKVAKYNYFPGWQKQSLFFEFLINKDVWSKMDDSQRATINLACSASIATTIAEGEAAQIKPINSYEGKGAELRRFSPEVLTGIETAWQEVASEESAKNAFFKKALDDLNAFRESYNTWGDNAFLPRK